MGNEVHLFNTTVWQVARNGSVTSGGKTGAILSLYCTAGQCVLFVLVRLTLRKQSQSPSAAAERRAVRALVQEAVPPMASSTYRPVDGGARECSMCAPRPFVIAAHVKAPPFPSVPACPTASTSLWGEPVTTSSLGGSVV